MWPLQTSTYLQVRGAIKHSCSEVGHAQFQMTLLSRVLNLGIKAVIGSQPLRKFHWLLYSGCPEKKEDSHCCDSENVSPKILRIMGNSRGLSEQGQFLSHINKIRPIALGSCTLRISSRLKQQRHRLHNIQMQKLQKCWSSSKWWRAYLLNLKLDLSQATENKLKRFLFF